MSCNLGLSMFGRSSVRCLSNVTTSHRLPYYGTYDEIPQKPRLPLWGHTYLYHGLSQFRIERYHDALQFLHDIFGPVFRQQLQDGTVVHVFDPKDVRAVMEATLNVPDVPPMQEGSRRYRLARGYSVGLGNMNGEEWRFLRQTAHSVLMKPQRMVSLLPGTDRCAKDLVDTIRLRREDAGNVKNLFNLLSRWYLDTAGMILYEKPLGGLVGGKNTLEKAGVWLQANMDILENNAQLKVASPLFKIFPIKPWRKLIKAEDTFYSISTVYMTSALEEMKQLAQTKQLGDRFSFLAELMARDLIRSDIIFFVNSLIADGLATVPSIVHNVIHCLSCNAEVQERAYQEVQQVINHDRTITVGDIDNLPYLQAIVKETFRFFPIRIEISRILPKDMELSGYFVPAGTVVNLNHSLMLMSDEHFIHPLRFYPERWMQGDESSTSNTTLLTPFGHGPRMCVGRHVSQIAIYVVLARLLLAYRMVKPPNDPPYGQVYRTVLFPERDLQTRFEERRSRYEDPLIKQQRLHNKRTRILSSLVCDCCSV